MLWFFMVFFGNVQNHGPEEWVVSTEVFVRTEGYRKSITNGCAKIEWCGGWKVRIERTTDMNIPQHHGLTCTAVYMRQFITSRPNVWTEYIGLVVTF